VATHWPDDEYLRPVSKTSHLLRNIFHKFPLAVKRSPQFNDETFRLKKALNDLTLLLDPFHPFDI